MGVSFNWRIGVTSAAGPELVKEFERRLRVQDAVLKFLSVRIDETLKRIEKRCSRRCDHNFFLRTESALSHEYATGFGFVDGCVSSVVGLICTW